MLLGKPWAVDSSWDVHKYLTITRNRCRKHCIHNDRFVDGRILAIWYDDLKVTITRSHYTTVHPFILVTRSYPLPY